MTNKNTNLKAQSGFTIVELLIVIVVIGILAAITIVAYSGITNRANAVKAQTNAESVQKVTEAYNADKSAYPTALSDLTTYSTTAGSTATIPTNITVQAAAVTSASLNQIQFVPKGTTGACIAWWDFANNAPRFVGAGNAVIPAGNASCS